MAGMARKLPFDPRRKRCPTAMLPCLNVAHACRLDSRAARLPRKRCFSPNIGKIRTFRRALDCHPSLSPSRNGPLPPLADKSVSLHRCSKMTKLPKYKTPRFQPAARAGLWISQSRQTHSSPLFCSVVNFSAWLTTRDDSLIRPVGSTRCRLGEDF